LGLLEGCLGVGRLLGGEVWVLEGCLGGMAGCEGGARLFMGWGVGSGGGEPGSPQ
jgi:hypothetical protein